MQPAPGSLGPWGKARVQVLPPRCGSAAGCWDGAAPWRQDQPPLPYPRLVLTRDLGMLLSSDGGISWQGNPRSPSRGMTLQVSSGEPSSLVVKDHPPAPQQFCVMQVAPDPSWRGADKAWAESSLLTSLLCDRGRESAPWSPELGSLQAWEGPSACAHVVTTAGLRLA